MGFFKLLITASMPVLNVLLITGLGSFLATGQVGILCKDARKHLNNVVFFVFNPALLSTNLARTITLKSIALLWFMPINILLTFLLGSLLGWAVIYLTKTPPRLKGLVLGCCAAGNMGNMLLIIIPTICKEKGSPFRDPDVCYKFGMAYVSLSMAIGAIFLWSYVYNMVRISSNSIGEKIIDNPQHTPKLPDENTDDKPSSQSELISDCPAEQRLPITVSAESSTKTKVSSLTHFKNKLSNIGDVIKLKKMFNPSTIGLIVGFFIGITPPFRKAIIGDTAPLRVIQESASLLGNGAIPTVTLIMGGNLLRGLRGSGTKYSIIFGVIVVRYVILPLIGVVIVRGAIHMGLVYSDPLFQFILLLQYAVPPAMNISTITQLFGAGENECSVIFLWVYGFASVSLTLWSTFFMWLLSH
ncbi:protein PIN-LIKES 3-like [Dioscorea cayenensis subsp. rotundata]|uniref:Protein PIN-LIKES 3-like n=1 Tax=Dioscorea cayennensis subsp. rotundata TaxID=55577 RepID=A0AB40AZ00_DIOCR|nr:protein PIN-LIKES 3-like [Dioscorea cayenensis subsp. rotundata]XP_039120160.1 protein PIN-LIKES 3-like [Dioscorea cayenensis subsp. rotundata]